MYDDNRVLDQIHGKFITINRELLEVWSNNILLSWRWWLNLGLAIVPWIIWIRYRNKNNTARLLFVGLVVAIVTEVMDIVGISRGLWHYDWPLLPLFPIFIPWNFSLFPVNVMFMLQIKPKVSHFIKAILFAGFCAYMMEPLFGKLGMYHNIKWSRLNSFVIYTLLYLFFYRIYKKLESTKI